MSITSIGFNEPTIELAALEWLADLGFQTAHGPDLAPEGNLQERDSFSDIVLPQWLGDAIDKLNPDMTADGRDEAFRRVTRVVERQLPASRQWEAIRADRLPSAREHHRCANGG